MVSISVSNIIGAKNIEVDDKRHFIFFFSKSHTPINQKGHENVINYPPKGIMKAEEVRFGVRVSHNMGYYI